jgi:hypothetical protein
MFVVWYVIYHQTHTCIIIRLHDTHAHTILCLYAQSPSSRVLPFVSLSPHWLHSAVPRTRNSVWLMLFCVCTCGGRTLRGWSSQWCPPHVFFRMLYYDQVMGKVQLDCHSSSSGGGGSSIGCSGHQISKGFMCGTLFSFCFLITVYHSCS